MAGQKIGDAYVDLNARFDKLEAALGKVDKEMVKTMKRAEKSTDSLGSAFTKLGGMIAGAFTVQKIAQFTVESIKLAGELEGVRHAYERVADPALMNELKEATRGTVSELELMKSVTNAANFGIAIERMPELLEFARRRAKDTGMEVDYLVRSLVTGLGRRSTLVLDNLGITAVQLREKMGGIAVESASIAQITEAVGDIAKDSYAGFSEGVTTAADKMQILQAKSEDLKAEIGGKLTPVFNELQEAALAALDMINRALKTNADEGRELAEYKFAMFTPDGRDPALVVESFGLELSRSATELKKLREQTEKFKEGDYSGFRSAIGVIDHKAVQEVFANFEKEKAYLDELGALYTKYLDDLQPKKKANAEMTEEEAAAIAAYEAKVADLNTEFELLAYNLVKASELKLVDLAPPSISTDLEEIPNLSDILGETTDQEFIQFLDDATKNINRMKIANEALLPTMNALQSGFQTLGNSIVDSLGLAETGFGRFISVLAKGAIDIIAQALATSIAQAITGASTAASFAGPFAPAVLPVTIATMVGSVMSAFAAIPAFAKGGIAPGGMALVGERGPELVNLPKGSMVYPNHETSSIMGKGGAGYLDVNVHGMLKGDKLYLAGERGANRLRR